MVLVFSSGSNTSEHVKNEVETAVSNEKPIIPIRVENALPSGSLALHLSRRQWLDAITPPLKKHLKKLAENIKGLLSLPEEAREKYAESSEPPSKPALRFYPQEKAKRLVWPLLLVFLLLVAGALALAGYWYFGSRPAVPFAERDWVLITDFENHTGNEVFDKSLSTAIMVSIEQSRYVNVLPRQRIRDALQRMKKEDVVHIDEIIGREIAEREGARVMIVPSISSVGETFVLTAKIQDVGKGDVLASQIVRAGSQDEVLGALDRLTRAVRRDLGESLAAISSHSKPLARVTTSSLEALKQYSIGGEAASLHNMEEAKKYYEQALRIDSNFTAAKASLALCFFEISDNEKAKKLLIEAVQNIDDLTDYEKYMTLAHHSTFVEDDLEKALGYQETLVALYPKSQSALSNLSILYSRLGRHTEALKTQEEAHRINPNDILTTLNLGVSYHRNGRNEDAIKLFKKAIALYPEGMRGYDNLNNMYIYHTGELDSAWVWLHKQISVSPDHAYAYENLGWYYWGTDSLDKAEIAFKKALELAPQNISVYFMLSDTYRLLGQYADGLRYLEKFMERVPDNYSANYRAGILFELMGQDKKARSRFEQSLSIAEQYLESEPDDVNHLTAIGGSLAHLGLREDALVFVNNAIQQASVPSDYFHIARVLAVSGKTKDALEQLEKAVEEGFTNFIRFKINPDLQSLQNEPEFLVLLDREL